MIVNEIMLLYSREYTVKWSITMLILRKKTKSNFQNATHPFTTSPFDSALPRSVSLSASILAHTTPRDSFPLAPQSRLEASLDALTAPGHKPSSSHLL